MTDLVLMAVVAGLTAGIPAMGAGITVVYKMGKLKRSVEISCERIEVVEATQGIDGQRISTLEGWQQATRNNRARA